MHRFIRNTLDPRLCVSKAKSLSEKIITNKELHDVRAKAFKDYFALEPLKCPMVDENNGFIPLLTNLINKCDGWPDIVLPTFTSKEGVRREQWSVADGSVDIYEVWDMNTSFKNMKDEPLILMFETWLRYMSYVYEGMMSPYIDFIAENEIDYMTRVYRIVLDESKTYVKKMAATGAAFPLNVPNGQFFDYDNTSKYNDNTKEISIRFRCHGAEYNDDILVKEFNEVNCIFNPDYRNYVYNPSASSMVEIPFNMLEYFNNRGYPFIDPNTLQLKWLISTNSKTYQNVIRYFKYRFRSDINNNNLVWKDGGNNWNVNDIKNRIKNNY